MTQTLPQATDTDPAARSETDDQFLALARALREIAGNLGDFALRDMPQLAVGLTIQISDPAIEDKPEFDQVKMATIDMLADAVLGKTGQVHPLSSGGCHYDAAGMVGPVRVGVFDSISSPALREKDAEIERLRAEVATLRGAEAVAS